MYIVLMAGGAGTRFWPRSRKDKPKQFLRIIGKNTMLQDTFERVKGMTDLEKILVVTGENLKQEVRQQLPDLPQSNIITEPFGKNTAPCIALASAVINKREKGKPSVMAILPADHLIVNTESFQKTLAIAARVAETSDDLITIGVKPLYPETGYGYIQRNSKITEIDGQKLYPVKTFAEKPNLETAERFLSSGDFYWNAGIFVWSIATILNAFEMQMPELFDMLPNLQKKVDTPEMKEEIFRIYSATKSISIDYAIMESAKNVSVIEAEFDWSDVGSWEAVYNLSAKNKDKNVSYTKNTIEINSRNNFFHSDNKKLIAAIDVEDLVMVETSDAILLCKKDSSQRVKEVVDKLKIKDLDDYL